MEKYGAGVASISEDTGIAPDIIKGAMLTRKKKYPKLYAFDDTVEEQCKKTRKITTLRTDTGYQRAIGYYRSPTNTVFHFLENESLQWMQDKGIMTSFSPTCMKNYPSQGLGGEIMQVQSGRVTRKVFEYNLRDDIKIMNTVHDSMYLDFRNPDIAVRWLPAMGGLLEDVSMYFNLLYPEVAWNTPFPVDIDYGLNIMEVNESITERTNEWVLR